MSTKNRSAVRLLVVLMVCMVPMIAMAPVAHAAGGAEVAAVQIDPLAVRWSPQGDYERLVLTVSKPGGAVVRREFAAGDHPVFDLAREAAGDGAYTWELRAVPRIDAATRKELAEARDRGDAAAVAERLRQAGRLPSGAMVQSGTFRVVNGALVPAEQKETRAAATGTGDPGGDRSGAKTAAKAQGIANLDQVIADDLIVQGSACVGLDCVNNESFGFDTIRLKENNTRIKFEDTSTGTGFPTHDWQLTANDSASGGAEKFSIEDVTASTVPFTVTGSAPTNSMFVDSTGRLGLRTSTPVLDLHIATSNTPAMRLEQTNAGGFTAQTWDIAGNEANFFVRDVTGGSRLPFRIRPGAPTSSIDINASGNVGVGTASPATKLDVSGSDGTTKLTIRETNGTITNREIFELRNNGGVTFAFTNVNSVLRWGVGMNGTDFLIDSQNHAGTEFTLSQAGNLTILGTLTQGSSRELKTNFASLDPKDVLSRVNALPVSLWSYKTESDVRHIGPMAEDFRQSFGLGADDKHIAPGDQAGVALLAVKGLNQVVQEKDKEITELRSRVEELEKLVHRLEKVAEARN
jgi:hypothetical protein